MTQSDFNDQINETANNITALEEEASLGTLSRSERRNILQAECTQAQNTLEKNFDFSKHIKDGEIYGIDVSHHNGSIDWKKVAQAGAKFSYVKATQGMTVTDRRFKENIQGSIDAGIATGAYHFLSSISDAEKQADNFIKQYSRYHTLCKLPPVVDIEWDFPPINPKNPKNPKAPRPDRWKKKKPEQIATMAEIFLSKVEKKLGKTPIIYTNKSWWDENIGKAGQKFCQHPLWSSRYGAFDQSAPPVMDNFSWVIWQFTDKGKINGIGKTIDVNVCTPELFR